MQDPIYSKTNLHLFSGVFNMYIRGTPVDGVAQYYGHDFDTRSIFLYFFFRTIFYIFNFFAQILVRLDFGLVQFLLFQFAKRFFNLTADAFVALQDSLVIAFRNEVYFERNADLSGNKLKGIERLNVLTVGHAPFEHSIP